MSRTKIGHRASLRHDCILHRPGCPDFQKLEFRDFLVTPFRGRLSDPAPGPQPITGRHANRLSVFQTQVQFSGSSCRPAPSQPFPPPPPSASASARAAAREEGSAGCFMHMQTNPSSPCSPLLLPPLPATSSRLVLPGSPVPSPHSVAH